MISDVAEKTFLPGLFIILILVAIFGTIDIIKQLRKK